MDAVNSVSSLEYLEVHSIYSNVSFVDFSLSEYRIFLLETPPTSLVEHMFDECHDIPGLYAGLQVRGEVQSF